MTITFGQKLQEFATQLGAGFQQHTTAHCKITTAANKYDVYYGRRGYSVIPKHGLAAFRTGTILDVIKYIKQCEAFVTAGSCCAAKPAAEAIPTKTTSREWAAAFAAANKRFPHALDYANSGYDQGSQCDCNSIGDCVLRDACGGHSCDRNCYTQQLKDYIVLSNTKAGVPKSPDQRPYTAENTPDRLYDMKRKYLERHQAARPLYVHITSEVEQLMQECKDARTAYSAVWQAGSWRPYSIFGMECVWDSASVFISQ